VTCVSGVPKHPPQHPPTHLPLAGVVLHVDAAPVAVLSVLVALGALLAGGARLHCVFAAGTATLTALLTPPAALPIVWVIVMRAVAAAVAVVAVLVDGGGGGLRGQRAR